MRRKRQEQGGPVASDHRLTPVDVQQVEFRLGFRGYSERDVDAFLDRITEDLSWYLEESERLRAGTEPPLAIPAPSAPTLQDGLAEADELLARAREEAASIVRRAEVDAAAIRAAAGSAGTGDTRAAVAPFLNSEREFLQSLGTLVQGHAEEIKQMVFALRARSETAPGAGAPIETVPEPSASPRPTLPATADGGPDERPSSLAGTIDGQETTAASASEIADRLGMPALTIPDAPEGGDEEEPLIIGSASTEPAFSSEGTPAGERRERSLRELFWGEE